MALRGLLASICLIPGGSIVTRVVGTMCRSASSSSIVGCQRAKSSRVFVASIRLRKSKAIRRVVGIYRVVWWL
jgi:hypothetical protein